MKKTLRKSLNIIENIAYLVCIGLLLSRKTRLIAFLALLGLVTISIIKNWEFFTNNIMYMIYSAERFLYGKPLKTRWDKKKSEVKKNGRNNKRV